MFSNNLGDGEIPLLSIWKRIHFGDQSEAISLNIQEAHGEDFPKGPEIGCEELPIPAI